MSNNLNSAGKFNILYPVKDFFKRNLGILLGLFVLCFVLTLKSPFFLTSDNMFNVLRQVSTNSNIALAMTLAIIIGGIDLSVGAVVALAGTLAAGFITNQHLSVTTAICLAMMIGTLIGLLNGLIIAYGKIPAFITTLATMNLARGMAFVYSGGMPIRTFVDVFNNIGVGYFGPIPLPVMYSIIFVIIVFLILNRTRLGPHIYAIGGNREAARFSGVNTPRVEVFVYTLSGFLAAFSGVVLACRMYSGQPSVGSGFEMDAIAAAVLGGTSMSGGIGKISGTIIGVLIIGILNNGLNLLNINSFWQLIVKGIVILIAVFMDISKKRSSGK